VKRLVACSILLAVVALYSGCGSDSPTSTPVAPGGGTPVLGDIDLFDIFLRPRSIQRAPDAGGQPNPHLSVHYLTAFFTGGSDKPIFDWQMDATLGELRAKSEGLGTDEASVTLLNGGDTPLGFYDITATGTSGGKTSSITRRIAAIENTWQKHNRATFLNQQDPPASLVLSPIFVPNGTGDEILYIEAPSEVAVNMRRITAYRPLTDAEQSPRSVFVPPGSIDGTQSLRAMDLTPDLSPVAMGGDQLLFSSQLDPDFGRRCPTPNCNKKIPLRIWTVKAPSGIVENEAKVMTQDSTFFFAGRDEFYAYDFKQPRWDPSATGYPARIAYFSDMDEVVDDTTAVPNIWLADLVDDNGDNRPDDLINHRRLTDFGRIKDYDWHPNGQSLYVSADPKKILKISVASGMVEKEIGFLEQDSLLTNPSGISVFQKPGGHTLIAFQGVSENLTHLYVYDEEDEELTRVSPFPFPSGSTLFPSWHPTKMWLTYSCDYSVNAWSSSADMPPLINKDFERQPRTAFPSMWVLKLED